MSWDEDGIHLGVGTLAIVLLIICFWGEPDLIDALIHFLMNCGGGG